MLFLFIIIMFFFLGFQSSSASEGFLLRVIATKQGKREKFATKIVAQADWPIGPKIRDVIFAHVS